MIIYKNPISVLIRYDIPNDNWTDETNVFVIDDNSILGKKILEYQPFFDFVTDENENLIDVTPTERPPEPPQPPTIDERISALEDAMLLNLGL